MELTYQSLAKMIDHALLLPTMTATELKEGCRLAQRYDVASVCIKPYAVPLAVDELGDSDVRVGTVVGFPHGTNTINTKIAEAITAINSGASEIDMVINFGQALSGNWPYLVTEVGEIAVAVREHKGLLKIIFETGYLDQTEIIKLCEICGAAQVDYVKTSTGFGPRGASKADLVLMKQNIPESVKLKASGGIKDLQTAIDFVQSGAQRLGLSRTAEILGEWNLRAGNLKKEVSRETNQFGENY